MTEDDFTCEAQARSLDKLYRQLLSNGWKMNDIDEADIYDLIRLLNDDDEEVKVERKESMLEAFM